MDRAGVIENFRFANTNHFSTFEQVDSVLIGKAVISQYLSGNLFGLDSYFLYKNPLNCYEGELHSQARNQSSCTKCYRLYFSFFNIN